MALTMRPTGLGSGIDKGPLGLHRRLWRLGGRSHLSGPRRSRQSALVLAANRQRSDDARGSRGDLGRGQGAVSEERGRLEGEAKFDEGA
jgi:hypothetical protein